jgi:hypothetical protein
MNTFLNRPKLVLVYSIQEHTFLTVFTDDENFNNRIRSY